MARHQLTGDYFLVDSTGSLHPTGNGGSVNDAGKAASIFATDRVGTLLSVIVTQLDAAVRTIVIEDYDGNTIDTIDTGFSNPGTATFSPSQYPYGPAGITFTNGLAANITGAAECVVIFRKGD